MRRSNEERLMGVHKPTPSEDVPKMANPMDFVMPTEFITLPSQGKYPENHPLHGKDTLEIRYMTAKDEDILTNRSLLKSGLALDRLIQNLIVDKSIDHRSLLAGDRNAIMIHARASAYGSDYKTKVQCPACGEISKFQFDLSDFETYYGDKIEEAEIIDNKDGTFSCTLPLSGIITKFKLLTGYDEIAIAQASTKNKKALENDSITTQMKLCVIDFNGYNDEKTINYCINNMLATDSKFLRGCLTLVTPDVIMQQDFTCRHCEHQEVVGVPFGTEFFWPDR